MPDPEAPPPVIYSFGHSSLPLEAAIAALKKNGVRHLVDVRSLPGSTAHPHFNKEVLAERLPVEGIRYVHVLDLGGRRNKTKGAPPTGWRSASFGNYAAHMEKPEFAAGLKALEAAARERPTAFMCSEGVWWKCHRAIISDALKARGWDVRHISGTGATTPHPYTGPARLDEAGALSYLPDVGRPAREDGEFDAGDGRRKEGRAACGSRASRSATSDEFSRLFERFIRG